jgi:hypothetical protein
MDQGGKGRSFLRRSQVQSRGPSMANQSSSVVATGSVVSKYQGVWP